MAGGERGYRTAGGCLGLGRGERGRAVEMENSV